MWPEATIKLNIALNHKEISFRSKDMSLVLALSLRRGLRRIVARVLGVLGAPAPWLSVSSHRCSNMPCIASVRIA